MLEQAAQTLRERLGFVPQVGLVLGSGLGPLAGAIEEAVAIPYGEVPGMAVSTAPGHAGQFVGGTLCGKRVLCMQGRLHGYEGHPFSAIAFPIRLMKRLGVEILLLTNAAGGIGFAAGEVMLISDHINLLGNNPLVGPNDENIGPRFVDMSYAYDPALRRLALEAAQEIGLPLREGVYLATLGPSFETPAEIRAFRTLGADAVGMSTVPEVIAANHCGLKVAALSLITNLAAGLAPQRLSGEEVIALGNARGAHLQALIRQMLRKL